MKNITVQNGVVFTNPSGMRVLLNHAGKPVRMAPRHADGVLFQQAVRMNLKLVNETSLIGQQIIARAKNN